MKKLKLGAIPVVFILSASLFSGCAKSDEAQVEKAQASLVGIWEQTKDEGVDVSTSNSRTIIKFGSDEIAYVFEIGNNPQNFVYRYTVEPGGSDNGPSLPRVRFRITESPRSDYYTFQLDDVNVNETTLRLTHNGRTESHSLEFRRIDENRLQEIGISGI